MRLTTTLTTITVAAFLSVGCSVDAPQEPTDETSDLSQFMSGPDSVHWVGNVLEFEVDNTIVRLERDQVDATEVSLFEDDELVGTIALTESGSSITAVTFTDASTEHWIKTNGDGDIIESSVA